MMKLKLSSYVLNLLLWITIMVGYIRNDNIHDSQGIIWVSNSSFCEGYLIVNQSMNWSDSVTYCHNLNAKHGFHSKLASFDSVHVFNEFRKYLLKQRFGDPVYEYWVGCDDHKDEGNFTWGLNGSKVDEMYWAPSQPDNANGWKSSGQHCCQLWKKNEQIHGKFKLDDGYCHEGKRFICQIGVTNLTSIYITTYINGTIILDKCKYNIDEIDGNQRNHTDLCPAETTVNDTGMILWPNTSIGDNATVKCPYNRENGCQARRECLATDSGAQWEKPDTSECLSRSEVTRRTQLNFLASFTSIHTGNAKLFSVQLKTLTMEYGNLQEDEINLVMDIVETILRSRQSEIDIEIARTLLWIVNNVMNTNTSIRIIKAVEKLSLIVQLGNQSQITIESPEIKMVVVRVNSTSFQELSVGASSCEVPGIICGNVSSMVVEDNPTIRIPKSVFTNLKSVEKDEITRAQFIFYKTARLFKAADIISSTTGFIASVVAAASIGDLKITNLEDPIKIMLPHKIPSNLTGNFTCVFWDFDRHGGNGGWSRDGCSVSETSKHDNVKICECDHLTNFALLMDVYDVGNDIDPTNQEAFSIISYVGCGISLLSLVVTIVTLVFFSKRRDRLTKILLNLCCALCMVQVIFLIGSFFVDFAPIIPEVCTAIAVLLHYFLLVVMAWMVLEAIQMYLLLVKVFQAYYRNFMVKISIIGWGIPLVIVVITVAVDVGNYGYRYNNTLCWLSRYAFLGAFLAPMSLVLIFNTVIFCLVIYQICGLNSKALTANERFTITAQLRAAVGFMVLLGLTWILAIFAIGDASLVFQYLFAIFNSLQGLFIFIFHCAMKKEIQSEWRKSFCKCIVDKYTSNGDTDTSRKATDVKYNYNTHESEVKMDSSTVTTGHM